MSDVDNVDTILMLMQQLANEKIQRERAENEARGRQEEQLRQQRRAERAEEVAASWESDALRLLQTIARVRALRRYPSNLTNAQWVSAEDLDVALEGSGDE